MKPMIIMITGAGSGFGFLLAEQLSRFHTVIAVVRKEEDARRWKQHGLRSVYLADISSSNEREALLEQFSRDFSSLDVLINNAGYCQGGVQEAMNENEWQNQLQTNVIGTAEITRLALPYLRKSPHAKIIQMGSISGRIGLPGLGLYAASKFALRGLSQSLRFELLPQKIYVSLLEISSYKTNIWKKSSENARLSKEAHYQGLQQMLQQHADNNAVSSPDPAAVVKQVMKILDQRKPSFLVPVGKPAKLLLMAEALLPGKILEWIVGRSLK